MTPTEQDNELREKLVETILSILGITDRSSGNRSEQIATLEQEITAYITADRKRVALEARIDEMERFANAKINHQGEPALFNPDGLPISTPITEEMARLVNQAAKDRLAQLRSTQ